MNVMKNYIKIKMNRHLVESKKNSWYICNQHIKVSYETNKIEIKN